MNIKLETARQEGLLEGIIRGQQEGMVKVAKNMLKNGFDLNTIAKNTGLKVAQVRALV